MQKRLYETPKHNTSTKILVDDITKTWSAPSKEGTVVAHYGLETHYLPSEDRFFLPKNLWFWRWRKTTPRFKKL